MDAAAVVLAAALVAAAVWLASGRIARELAAARAEAGLARRAQLLALLTPGLAAAERDPRALLATHSLARLVRRLFPDDAAALEREAGGAFPFSREQVQAVHSQWTAEWLAWERTHDGEYKRKAAEAEEALRASGGSAAMRAKLESIEREKLDLYQRRYEEYVRVAKALQALID